MLSGSPEIIVSRFLRPAEWGDVYILNWILSQTRETKQLDTLDNLGFHPRQLKLFEDAGLHNKALLLASLDEPYTEYYTLGDTANSFYGELIESTGQLRPFALEAYDAGMVPTVNCCL